MLATISRRHPLDGRVQYAVRGGNTYGTTWEIAHGAWVRPIHGWLSKTAPNGSRFQQQPRIAPRFNRCGKVDGSANPSTPFRDIEKKETVNSNRPCSSLNLLTSASRGEGDLDNQHMLRICTSIQSSPLPAGRSQVGRGSCTLACSFGLSIESCGYLWLVHSASCMVAFSLVVEWCVCGEALLGTWRGR
jgi:hypothetical protein